MIRSMLLACSTLAACCGPFARAQPVIGQPLQAGSPYAAYYADPAQDPALPRDELVAALRRRVRYVFVLFQENRSFDSYFGSFPGANGLFSDGLRPRSPADTPGFEQPLTNTDGTDGVQRPFRIGPAQHAADLDDVDHSHARMAAKMDLVDGVPRMDRFARVEEAKYSPAGAPIPSLKAHQFGELAMAYEDCDTVPLLWNYAARFTLFDNIFQTTIGPSTPNAIAMISGQVGETQWVKHPEAIGTALPVTGDPIPFWGSAADATAGAQRQPANTLRETSGKPDVAGSYSAVAQSLTFASLPLTLAGRDLPHIAESDAKPDTDLADVAQDVPAIAGLQRPPVAWRWYQEGYGHEGTDTDTASHASYVGHHNGAQYFGYVSNNPQMTSNMKGLGDFFDDMSQARLPPSGGVIYVRGGYGNVAGLRPAFNTNRHPAGSPEHNEAAIVEQQFLGDDDHPAYSDSEISEALVAREVNAIAGSPYWGQSAIIITYDESEGDYDHVPPRILSFDPAGLPLSRGPRIPLILLSPFARAHATSREEGDHNSVIKLIDALFGLPPLADLPDELQARLAGQDPRFATGGAPQTNLGPHDDRTPGTGDLLSGFDPARLLGQAPPIPAAYALVPPELVDSLPHYGGQGCHALGLTPVDVQQGYAEPIPPDFNPRPSSFPH